MKRKIVFIPWNIIVRKMGLQFILQELRIMDIEPINIHKREVILFLISLKLGKLFIMKKK